MSYSILMGELKIVESNLKSEEIKNLYLVFLYILMPPSSFSFLLLPFSFHSSSLPPFSFFLIFLPSSCVLPSSSCSYPVGDVLKTRLFWKSHNHESGENFRVEGRALNREAFLRWIHVVYYFVKHIFSNSAMQTITLEL